MNVTKQAAQIADIAAEIDVLLAKSLAPNNEDWSTEDLVAAYVAVKEAAGEFALVVKMAEVLACDALGRDTITVNGRQFKTRSTPKRTWPTEKKQQLRTVMESTIAKQVARNPLTGELEEDRARVAAETITAVDQWQTLDASKFKTTTLRKEGVDVGEYAETEWVYRIEEVRQ